MMECPLPITIVSYDEYWAIFHPVLEGGFQVAGIRRNMHWEIVHGPLKYQGLGIPSHYTIQGISHMEALLDSPPIEGITDELLTCLVKDLKIEIRLPSKFLQHNY